MSALPVNPVAASVAALPIQRRSVQIDMDQHSPLIEVSEGKEQIDGGFQRPLRLDAREGMLRHGIERRGGRDNARGRGVAVRGRMDLELAVVEVREPRLRRIDFEIRRRRRSRPSQSCPDCETPPARRGSRSVGQPSR